MSNQCKEGTLQELSARLFSQLDAITNDDLHGEALKEEIERTKQVVDIGKTIIATADIMIKARVAWDNKVIDQRDSPKLLAIEG